MITAIDLFAGLGGWTEAAERAGVRVLWTANHWPLAVEYHAMNHPAARHVCQDLHQADWRQVPAHDLLLASPCCQGHSRSRGKDRPHHDASRATAWAVVSCAEYHRPGVVIVENVPEFLNWSLYASWADAMRRLGYSLSQTLIDSADCGVPQHRVRVFIVATLDQPAMAIWAPSMEHVPAASVVDFAAGNWSLALKRDRALNTKRRYRAGREQYGERFCFSYYGNTTGGRSLERPIGTITTHDRWAVVDGRRMRMLSIPEARAFMGFPSSYQLPANSREAMHLLGNAVVPAAGQWVIEQVFGGRL